uniref:PUM-HD domain-containing protein n=1 Tax=Anopheles dirus TaxID=7168 RepID=A0A182N5H7_9DIPT
MLQTKKRTVSSSENTESGSAPATKPVKRFKKELANATSKSAGKPKLKLQKKDGTVVKSAKNKTGATGKPVGKFQKKTIPGGKPFDKGEKKPFVANTPESKKEYWNGLKAKQKELRQQRRQSKSKELYELSVRAKKIYEKLKCNNAEGKEELVQKLHELLGKENAYAKIATSHDTARVIQCLIKKASESIQDQIANSLLPALVDVATSKYGHRCVSSLLKRGSKQLRARVVDAIIKEVLNMVNHTFSSAIVDSAYNEYATNEQRSFMRQSFYSGLYKLDKDRTVRTMKDCWQTNTYMKTSVLTSVKGHLLLAANKQLTDNSLLHALLAEFLDEAGTTDRAEVIELYLPLLASISSTRDGTEAAITCFVHSVVKDRRAALKAMKPYVEKLCIHEHGHRLIMCVLNCYDDTVTLAKQVLSPIMEQIETIVGSGEWGRKVVGWIFSPDDKVLLHPTQIELLSGYLEHSKKDKEIRRKEVLAAVTESFCKQVEANASFWLRGGHTALLTAAILKNFTGEPLGRLHRALATVVCDPEWKVHENEINLDGSILSSEADKKPNGNVNPTTKPTGERKIKKIKKSPFEEEKAEARAKQLASNPLVNGTEHAGLHIALKKMIKQNAAGDDESQFGRAIVDALTDDQAAVWITQNRTSFLLLLAFENSTADVQQTLQKKVSAHKKVLKAQKHTGGKLLAEKLNL